MSKIKRRVRQSLLATACTVGALLGTAAPAHAVTWYSFAGWCGGGGVLATTNCTVEYTGSWPSGQARAQGQGGVYGIALQTRVGLKGDWIVRKATWPGQGGPTTTPATAVGKNNYYRTCVKYTQGQRQWACSRYGSIYLGD